MKIGLSGTHGVGKTTLAIKLLHVFRNANMQLVSGIARDTAVNMGISSSREIIKLNEKAILRLQNSIIFNMLQKQHGLDSFISDRTIIDALAYTYYYINVLQLGSANSVNAVEKMVQFYLQIVHKYYDVIVYCPIPHERNIVDDGFRFIDEQSQEIVADIITSLLHKQKTSVIWLSPNRHEWLDMIVKECSYFGDVNRA